MTEPATAAHDLAEPTHQAMATGPTLGGWTVGARVRETLIASVHQCTRGEEHGTIHLVHPQLAKLREVVAALSERAPRTSHLTDHRNVLHVLGAGHEQGHLYVVTEAEDGPILRDVLDRKHAGTGLGLPSRGAGNVLALVAQGLISAHDPGQAGLIHGAIGDESVTISRGGRIAITDLALGPALCAAIALGAVKAPGWIAPEVLRGEPPTAVSDVYGLGALLYDALVGQPLTRGGPRPSEVCPGLPPEVDEIIARACAEKPDRRFGSVAALRELVMDVLLHGAADEDEPGAGDSLASAPRPALAIPPALEAAMEDPHERWLVTKGRFDFGPFSMKSVVDQIVNGHIHHGAVLFDKDDGGRVKVEEHPLLGPLIDAAKQAHDDARRAHAEVKHQSRERNRGVTLYAGIALGLAAAVVGVYLLIQAVSSAGKGKQVAGASVTEATLKVTVSAPKAPERKKAVGGGGGRRTSGGGGGGGGNDVLAFDMSDENDATETLDMGTVYNVYSRFGGQLGGCLQRTGGSSVNISIIIDGPTGRVTWLRTNGESSGALFSCINGVMRSMKFPTINGPRTRAEFDISM